MNSGDIMSFEVSELAFDVENPRLAKFDTGGGEPEVIKMLWEMMDVEELVLSIAASGYFPHEWATRGFGLEIPCAANVSMDR